MAKKIELVMLSIENFELKRSKFKARSIFEAIQRGQKELYGAEPYVGFYVLEEGKMASKEYYRGVIRDWQTIINWPTFACKDISFLTGEQKNALIVKGGYVVIPEEGTQLILG